MEIEDLPVPGCVKLLENDAEECNIGGVESRLRILALGAPGCGFIGERVRAHLMEVLRSLCSSSFPSIIESYCCYTGINVVL